MLIGIDFDNTLAGYDRVFAAAALSRGLVPADFSGGRRQLRDLVRARPNGERDWMALQGEVYGPRMAEAEMIEGAAAFLLHCRAEGLTVAIVSHKTEFGHFDSSRTNLRQAATAWMTTQGFFDRFAVAPESVFFETTRDDKIARITQLGCAVFIDDLEEVLLDPAFPRQCRRLHLAIDMLAATEDGLDRFPGWKAIEDDLFARA